MARLIEDLAVVLPGARREIRESCAVLIAVDDALQSAPSTNSPRSSSTADRSHRAIPGTHL